MANFWFPFFLTLLLLIPPALLVLGILLRNEKYGLYLFVAGWNLISTFLLPYVSELVVGIICAFLHALGITASFHDTMIIDAPLIILSFWGSFKVFSLISKPRKSKSKKQSIPSSSPSMRPDNPTKKEVIYYMEAANGMMVRVPESKLESWQAAQERIKNNPEAAELTEQEKLVVERILRDIYGPKSENK